MTLTHNIVQKIITRLLHGNDYRIEIVALLNAQFLDYAIDFFKKVANAKLENQSITIDWYKKEFLDSSLPSNDIAINSGLNKKTISNMYNSARKEIVIEASLAHYDKLYQAIESLVTDNTDVDIALTIQFRDVSIKLNINESLIVINTLAVKRSALRGGLWSTAGKQVEKPLMITLCKLFQVPTQHYNLITVPQSLREVDFYLIDAQGKKYRCEVKLMGKGNPESADVVYARDTNLFIADKLSDLNKQQLTKQNIDWVELRAKDGYQRFLEILYRLDIPGKMFQGNIDDQLKQIFAEIFN